MWIDDFSNRSLVTEATIKGPHRMSVASDRISSRCSSSQGASRRTSPGARENRTGIPMVRTSPSEGCSSRLKNPSARKCSSSSKSSGERTAQAGQEEIRSSGSSTPGLSDSVRPAGIRSGPRRAVDRDRFRRRIASEPNGNFGLTADWRWSHDQAPTTKSSRGRSSNRRRRFRLVD